MPGFEAVLDFFWILIASQAIGAPLPGGLLTYDDFVALSLKMMRGGPNTVKLTVLRVLRSIAFPGFSTIFRTLFPGSSRFACKCSTVEYDGESYTVQHM